ncbi:MAG: flagellar biosynthetic protein FliR [Verrucomicrobia bacterium]|nr:flagellar biosynthetic protein FliR [Verrucomicrobiota bacterium]MBS0646071.1 flagellar biosynthetic protein FliR [Verrucomicrobiota bacterium]
MWPNTFFNNWLALFPIFARFFGFFCLSPFFIRCYVPWHVRLILSILCTCLLLPFLPLSSASWLVVLQELFIGYLLGVLVTFLFEAAALAGQLLGALSGFSATELFDPLANQTDPILSRLFVCVLCVFFFLLDGHHVLLRFLYESFYLSSNFSMNSLKELVLASSQLLNYAIDIALLPLLFLGGITVVWSLTARFVPHLQIFWIGLPLNILVGIMTLAVAFSAFPQKLDAMLHTFLQIAKKALFSL